MCKILLAVLSFYFKLSALSLGLSQTDAGTRFCTTMNSDLLQSKCTTCKKISKTSDVDKSLRSSGIVVFLIVEKIVRYVEEFSGGENAWGLGHHHHHHHHKHTDKLKDDGHALENHQGKRSSEKTSEEKDLDRAADTACSDKKIEKDVLRKRNTSNSSNKDGTESSTDISNGNLESIHSKEPVKSQSNLVIGYLNLFSDGVIGDFGILVRSGFSVTKALFFNFLSALVALAGTALALIWGKDPGHSSWIEGFTAGGFIYIALAGVLAEMNNGTSALRNTAVQIISLLLGMAVALCISLVE
ncbi:UNVERIFIED_CONTAM: IAA-alanine resistance protein 1 [Sesamum radiatum]|uniref:IAA-alanine resistance protein 1 n=1 Tax=Sesamum radiatum TaxID=300843 RepID=A0AAW2TXN1_SESRA